MNEENVNIQNNNPIGPQWSEPLRYIALVCLLIVIVFCCILIRGSLTLIVLAALVAYLLSPLVRLLNKKLHINRKLAIILAYLFLFLLIGIAVSFIIPVISQGISNFFAIDWPQVLSTVENYIGDLAEDVDAVTFQIGGFTIDLSSPLERFQDQIHSIQQESLNIGYFIPDIDKTIRQIFSFSTNIFGQILTALIMTATTLMASIYFCRDGEKIAPHLVSLFEEKYQPEISELLHRLSIVWSHYFTGELKLMLFVGGLTFVIYSALGLRWALILGLVAGFCEVVPNIGPILATIPAIISALIFGSRWIPLNNFWIGVLAVIASFLIQQTENNILVPHIMGNALELHPVVIIIGILTLSSQMGIIGAIFAAPIIAIAKEIFYYIISKIKKQDPYPEIYIEKHLEEEV